MNISSEQKKPFKHYPTTMKPDKQQIEFMQEDLCVELLEILMQDQHCSMQQALDLLYNSETFLQVRNPSTGLYYQSAGYVYDYLQHELQYGTLA